jgi:hypothetical protein
VLLGSGKDSCKKPTLSRIHHESNRLKTAVMRQRTPVHAT